MIARLLTLLLCLAVLPGGIVMRGSGGGGCTNAPAHVQSTNVSNTGTSCSVAYGSAISANGTLIVAIQISHSGTAVTPSIDDTLGDTTFTLDASQDQTTGGYHKTWIWSANSAGGGSNTVTVSWSGTQTCYMAIHEYSNIPSSSPVDVTATDEGDGTTALDSGSNTTTCTKDLLFGVGTSSTYQDSAHTVGNFGIGSAATKRQEVGGGRYLVTADKSDTGTGSRKANFTALYGNDWTALFVAYKGS